jgi:hypothetical protein
MRSNYKPLSNELSLKEAAKIKDEIEKIMHLHINAKDAASALSCYADSATIASNGFLYPSFDLFERDIKLFYKSLSKINLAVWDEIYLEIINTNSALVTAKFRWISTDKSNEETNLQGVWSALFIKIKGGWKMRVRHESFAQ